MKKLLPVLLVIITLCVNGQAPQAVNYQAVARDAAGNVLANRNISVKITINEGLSPGYADYQETHSATTNQFGLFTLKVGLGNTVSGNFSSINWSTGNKYMLVEFDPNGGSNYSSLGSTQLLSVPYALYAATSGNGGTVGATGPIGLTGAQGPVGAEGRPGVQGSVGPAGSPGVQGATGPQGVKGDQGIQGVTGSVGEKGTGIAALVDNGDGTMTIRLSDQQSITVQLPKGATGAIGSTGMQGPAGVTGAKGDQGPAGPSVSLGLATGDLSGSFPNPTVVALHGNPVSSEAPSAGNILLWDGNSWKPSDVTKNLWSVNGNAGTGTEFIGTTNVNALIFKSNNMECMRINPVKGDVVVGATSSPYATDLFTSVSNAKLPYAIAGYSAYDGSGIWGQILSGNTTNYSAVQGVYAGVGDGSGVLGNYIGTSNSPVRSGVYGTVSGAVSSVGGIGVHGYNSIAGGNERIGVMGNYSAAAWGIGVLGLGYGGAIPTGNLDMAVVGWRSNNTNYSGYFNGNHVVANGTKSASVGTSKGNQLLYCMESPEVWFEDFGSGKLTNGQCTITLDSLFMETVVIDEQHPMHVFVQMEGEAGEVYVVKNKSSFVVKEKNGSSNAEFSYRIVAKRVNFQDHRFGNDPLWGSGDTRQFMQYAPPPPIDYKENVKFQEEVKKNWKPTPLPAGFKYAFQLQDDKGEVKSPEVKK